MPFIDLSKTDSPTNSQKIPSQIDNQVVQTSGPQFQNPVANNNTSTTVNPVSQKSDRYIPPAVFHSNQQPNNYISGVKLTNNLNPENTQIFTYLDLCENRGASDIHFAVGYPPMLRIDGRLEKIGSDPLSFERSKKLFIPILSRQQIETLENDKELDFSIQHKTGARFRINMYFERGNLAAAFRLVTSKIRTISELNLPDILYNFIKIPHGLILVTGPTGSGKSTTLAAMINEINLNYPKHIITLEDPIEYVYDKAQALIDQREMGKDTNSWENALRSILRQDPDVVLVGEMRDYTTIASTVTVAETGHLVFATLHTNSASETIDRIIDVFPEFQQQQIRMQLSNVLVAVISQRLVPLKQGGRSVIIEVLLGTTAVKNAIREGKTYQIDNMIQTGADVGMIALEKSLAQLVMKGQLDFEVAKDFTTKPDLLKDLIQ